MSTVRFAHPEELGHEVPAGRRSLLRPLFEGRPHIEALVEAVLEGAQGRAGVDDPTTPRVAWLSLGCYLILGGDANAAAAGDFIRGVPVPREILFPAEDPWRELIRAIHGNRLAEEPMQGHSAASLDLEHLRRLAEVRQADLEVCPFDEELVEQLGPSLRPHAGQSFDTSADFLRSGLGFCTVAGGQVTSAATSYARSRRRVEIAIATHPDHRRRGLATLVAATLAAHCLEQGLVPHWNAANAASERLAERLGYRPNGICEVLALPRGR